MKIVEFINRKDPDEVAHNEQLFLDLHFPFKPLNSLNYIACMKHHCKFCMGKLVNFAVCIFGTLGVKTGFSHHTYTAYIYKNTHTFHNTMKIRSCI